MPLMFEQQPRESARAYAAFKTYLEMGSQRSLAQVAQKSAKSLPLLKRWSAKYEWPARVQAHAAHLAELERVAIQGVAMEKAVEWHKTHEAIRREAWQEAEKTIAMVRRAREEWEKSGRAPGFEGMARMLELAFKLKQIASGMPSEIKEVNTNITGTIDVDWEIAIRKAYQAVPGPNSPAEPAGKTETVVDAEIVSAPQPSSALRAPSPAPASEGHSEVKP
ncbi:MAG: hypothetical protein WCH99_15155 [Verrucomicrobiota bacterium]